jgi:Tfp pilus assembly protein FimT
MGMNKTKANSTTTRTRGGFSAIELIVTATILAIVTGLGMLGISRARASVRLSGAAREYGSYIEKARVFSIRRHADDAGERATVTINDNRTSYNVTMDLDGDGTMDTKTIALPNGIAFDTVETIAFDWRGRTWSTVGGLTSSNAQVSIRLRSSNDSVSIDVTGSGDITIDSKVFDDSVPNVNLRIGDLALGATPTPSPFSVATPSPSPEALATPDLTQNPTPTPTPISGGTTPLPTPTATPTPTPTPTPTATPTPTPTPTPTATPTPTPMVCTLSTDQSTLLLSLDGTGSIKVSHSASVSLSISGTSSKASEIQVTPGSAQTVAPGGNATFTVKSKKSIGVYSVTFSTSCGSKTVPVVVLL